MTDYLLLLLSKICNLTKDECLKIFKKEFCIHHIIRNKKVYNPFHLISLCPHCHTKILKFQNDSQDYFYAKNLSLI